MPRRRVAAKREKLPDPKFHSELLARFINHVMQDGKKSLAERIVYGALDILAERLKLKGNDDTLEMFEKIIRTVSPSVEVKSRRVGGSTYQVPVEVRPSRRTALAIRWIVDAAKGRSEKTMRDKLAGELCDVADNKGTAMKKRDDTHRMANANKAFAHFRW